MALLLGSCDDSAISPETGISPSGPRLKNGIEGLTIPKKEARPIGPGDSLRVAAQYIQKTPKNNGLFGVWLAEFGSKMSPVLLQNCHGRRPRMAATINATPKAPTSRPVAMNETKSEGKLPPVSAAALKMSAQRPGRSRIMPTTTINAVAQPLRC
jgi:hypothetical protein